MTAFVTRFAPSPTGLLHLGHAFSALSAARAAVEAGGTLLLRIEDIDRARCKPEFEAGILDDLEWLGVKWAPPLRRQSEHFADYAAALSRLVEQGLAYRCFRTRSEIIDEIARAPHLSPSGPEGPRFFGGPAPAAEEASLLAAGAPFAWRLSIAAARARLGPEFDRLAFMEEGAGPRGESGRIAADGTLFGDVVIARKDLGASYHLAATHDDALAGVACIIRGEDLFPATHLHCLLQAIFGWPTPIYRHHRLVTDENGRRFAKRDRAVTLRAIRESGVSAAEVRRRLGFD